MRVILILALFIAPLAASAADVTLAWDASTTNTDGSPINPPLQTYRLEWGTCNGTDFGSRLGETRTAETRSVVRNLTAGTVYCFRLYARNTGGVDSVPAQLRLTTDQVRPATPANLRVGP